MTEATLRMEGDYVIAENDDGHHIGVCDLDADISALIVTTAADIGYGTIAFSRPKNNIDRYILASKVILPPGIALDFRGSTLDLTGLDDIAFQWGSDEGWSVNVPNRTGIQNVHALGLLENPHTWLATATNIHQGILFENCKLWTCNNGIEVRGASYDAVLRNIYSEYLRGEFVRIISLPERGYGPNNALVDHAEIFGSGDASVGINIVASNGVATESVAIRNSWLEHMQTGIYDAGKSTKITDCNILALSNAIHTKGNRPKISGGSVTTSGGASIYVDGPEIEVSGVAFNYGGLETSVPTEAIVEGCKFYDMPTAIKGPWMSSTFTANRMRSYDKMHVFASIQGAYYNEFTGNNIKNGVIFVDGSPSDNAFIGNTISLNSSATLGNRCTFSDNTVTGNFTLNMGHSSIVMGNRVQGLATVSIGGNSLRQGNLMTGG